MVCEFNSRVNKVSSVMLCKHMQAVHYRYMCCTSLWHWISCKIRICIFGLAINFRAAPIVMKLNFNYSFQGSYGWSPSTLKIICLFVNLEGRWCWWCRGVNSSFSGKCRRFLWQSGHNYVWGCSQVKHGPMSLTCSPPQTERGWGALSLFSIILRATQIQMSADKKKERET